MSVCVEDLFCTSRLVSRMRRILPVWPQSCPFFIRSCTREVILYKGRRYTRGQGECVCRGPVLYITTCFSYETYPSCLAPKLSLCLTTAQTLKVDYTVPLDVGIAPYEGSGGLTTAQTLKVDYTVPLGLLASHRTRSGLTTAQTL